MTSHPSPDDTDDLRQWRDLVLELHRDIHDRLRELEAVDDAILGELRAIHSLFRRPATRRADQA